VGLPTDDDMGNSEVGHNALGSGQVVDQGASLVDKALASGQAFAGPGWAEGVAPALAAGGTLHLVGLMSDGGVHSRLDQVRLLIRGAVERGCRRLRLHVLSDGRDVPDGTSVGYAEALDGELAALTASGACDARIASGGGRMCVTMDRYEADWGIVERGYRAHVLGEAERRFGSGAEAFRALRRPPAGGDGKEVSDQWLDPFVVVEADGTTPVGAVRDGDAVVTFNFRADRMVEMAKALEYDDAKWAAAGAPFSRASRTTGRVPSFRYAGIMQYDGDLGLPARCLVDAPVINRVSGQYLVGSGVRTFACSETQKFGHVTFFWNGNRSGYFSEELETFVEIPSDTVPFDQAPLMKVREITAAGLEALRSGRFDMVRINYANPDMVGHTGNLEQTAVACAACDAAVGELLAEVDRLGGRWLVTSDHGNADDMVQRNKKGEPIADPETGKNLPLTSHTLAPVPVAVGGAGLPDSVVFRRDLPDAGLANVTATSIELLGFKAPEHMEASLI